MNSTPHARFWRGVDWLSAAAAIVAILFLLAQIRRVDPAIFRVDARTDSLQIGFPDGNALPWPSDWLNDPVPGCEGAPLRINKGGLATVSWRRDGRADILIEQAAGTPAATLACADTGATPTAWTIRLTVPLRAASPTEDANGQFFMLPFSGTLRLGSGLTEGEWSPAILRSARITVEMPARLTGAGRTDIEHVVETGDTIEFIADDSLPTARTPARATMIGFILFDSDPGVRVVARGRARDATVSFHGADKATPGIIAPTLFGRLKASAEYIVIVPILWLLSAFVRALRRATEPAAAAAPPARPQTPPAAAPRRRAPRPPSLLALAIGLGLTLLFRPDTAVAQPGVVVPTDIWCSGTQTEAFGSEDAT